MNSNHMKFAAFISDRQIPTCCHVLLFSECHLNPNIQNVVNAGRTLLKKAAMVKFSVT